MNYLVEREFNRVNNFLIKQYGEVWRNRLQRNLREIFEAGFIFEFSCTDNELKTEKEIEDEIKRMENCENFDQFIIQDAKTKKEKIQEFI